MGDIEYKWEFEVSPHLEVLDNDGEDIAFRTSCSCREEKHKIDVWIDRDPKYKDINMTFYVNVSWADYWTGKSFENFNNYFYNQQLKKLEWYNKYNWFKKMVNNIRSCDFKIVRIWRRIQCAARVLFTGEVEMEHGFHFRSLDHAEGFINGMASAVEKLKQR